MNKLIEALVRTDTGVSDKEWLEQALSQIESRFIDERVRGLVVDGKAYPPIPLEQAQARWQKAKALFVNVLTQNPVP